MQRPVRPADRADDIEFVVRKYSDTVYRICLVILGNVEDAEDALQETMLRYYKKGPEATDEQHRKSWLIRVASNICRDILRRRHNDLNLDDCFNIGITDETIDVLHQIVQLPEMYKLPLILYHIEGYKTEEISKILHVSSAVVRKRLQKGRVMLKLKYGKE